MKDKARWSDAVGAAVTVFCTVTAAAVLVVAVAAAERHATGGVRLLRAGGDAANRAWIRRNATLSADDNFGGFRAQVTYVYEGQMRAVDRLPIAGEGRWAGGSVHYLHTVRPSTMVGRPYADTYTVTVGYGLVLLCMTFGMVPLASHAVRVRLLGWLRGFASIFVPQRRRRRGFAVQTPEQ